MRISDKLTRKFDTVGEFHTAPDTCNMRALIRKDQDRSAKLGVARIRHTISKIYTVLSNVHRAAAQPYGQISLLPKSRFRQVIEFRHKESLDDLGAEGALGEVAIDVP
jgi:hypothetical protein